MADVIFWSICIIFIFGLLLIFSDWFIALVKNEVRNLKRKEKIKRIIFRYYVEVYG